MPRVSFSSEDSAPEQWELDRDEAEGLLSLLEDCSIELSKEEEFVIDMMDRFKQRGRNMRVTEPQLRWLRDIEDRGGSSPYRDKR